MTSSACAPSLQYRGHDVLDLLKEARNYNGWLVDQVLAAKPANKTRIADLGAGRGTFAEMLRARSLDVVCIEPDGDNQATLEELGFDVLSTSDECAQDSLDYVYTLNVLEHVPDDAGLARDVFARLRKGGRLFVFVPAFPILWSKLDDHVEHQRRYRRSSAIKMLQRAGFVVERARYADSLGFFAAFLFGRSSSAEITPRSIWIYDRFLFPISRLLDPVLGLFFGKNLALVCRKE